MGKKLLFKLVVAVCVVVPIVDCTCYLAFAAPLEESVAPPKCHLQQEVENNQSEPLTCCGKCEIEKSAIVQSRVASNLTAHDETWASDLSALKSKGFSLEMRAGFRRALFEASHYVEHAPYHSSIIPRAPPVV